MFASESRMTYPVRSWMESIGLIVRPEFITPWGQCDLVGLSFKKSNVKDRLRLGQRSSVSSLTRAGLLLRIPDIETSKAVRLKTLVKEYSNLIDEDAVRNHVEQLIAKGFVKSLPGEQLQRLNGWFPLQKRFMAVELKLFRIDEALRQAANNLQFSNESYVGLPRDVALRVVSRRQRWNKFFAEGVGLLSVTPKGCEVLIRSRPTEFKGNEAVQFYCVEKFWKEYSRTL